MRYQVQAKIRGEWETLDFCGSIRMAQILAEAHEVTWAKFGKLETRIVDSDAA